MMDAMGGKGGHGARSDRLGPTRADVLHHLRDAGHPLPVAEISAAVGLHPNTTRFHLDSMVASGLVTRTVEARSQPGRPRVLYASVAGHRTDQYRGLAAALVHHLAADLPDRLDRARTAGRAWGDQLRVERDPVGAEPPVERLVSVMRNLGYEPEYVAEPAPTVVLRPCPFLELVQSDAGTMCELHVGLASGLLGPDAGWEVAGVEPLVTASSCLIRLAALPPGSATAGSREPAHA